MQDIETRLFAIEQKLDKLLQLQPRESQQWYTCREAGEILSYSPDTIKRYCQDGVIRGELRRMPKRRKMLWYISEQALQDFKSHV